MKMIRKAYASDFENIYELLLDFRRPSISKEDWQALFVNHWRSDEDHFGYILVDNKDKVCGFLGTIFGKRYIRDREYRFCNMTSWIVKEEFKSSSLNLLFPMLKLKNYLVTNLSPSPTVRRILTKFGFSEVESHCRLLLPFPNAGSVFKSGESSISFDRPSIRTALNHDEGIIFDDHSKFKCLHMLIQSDSGKCYCILTRRKKFKIPFALFLYIGNKKVFTQNINAIRLMICRELKVAGIIVDGRFLENYVPAFSVRHSRSCFYKGERLESSDIDNIYSELLILNQ